VLTVLTLFSVKGGPQLRKTGIGGYYSIPNEVFTLIPRAMPSNFNTLSVSIEVIE
jgi:hypothetical protein